jgi:hypothetical protein
MPVRIWRGVRHARPAPSIIMRFVPRRASKIVWRSLVIGIQMVKQRSEPEEEAVLHRFGFGRGRPSTAIDGTCLKCVPQIPNRSHNLCPPAIDVKCPRGRATA